MREAARICRAGALVISTVFPDLLAPATPSAPESGASARGGRGGSIGFGGTWRFAPRGRAGVADGLLDVLGQRFGVGGHAGVDDHVGLLHLAVATAATAPAARRC